MRDELGTDCLWLVAAKFILAILDARDELIAQSRFFADLRHGAADPVHVVRGWGLRMCVHPCKQIGVGGETLAAGKDLPQARRREARHVGEKFVGGPIAIAQEREQDGKVRNRSAILLEIAQRLVVQNHEARVVEILEFAEGDDRCCPASPCPGRSFIEREQRSQPVHALCDDRRDDHEM